ncbi:hypothetical protein EJB05_49490, partial [Eragrostis curvula]
MGDEYYFRDGKRQERNHVILLTSSPMDKYSLTEAGSLVAAPVAFQQDPMSELHDGSSWDESWAGCGRTPHVPHEPQTSSRHNAGTLRAAHSAGNGLGEAIRLWLSRLASIQVPDLGPKYKISVLASKQEHCLSDLLYRWQEGRLSIVINCVLRRSRNNLHFLSQIHTQCHSINSLRYYLKALSKHMVKIYICETYGKDIINIHHGLLPSLKGEHPSRQVEQVSHRDTLQRFIVKSENLCRSHKIILRAPCPS